MIKSNKGFTLVELIVVIAILAILAGIAIPAYSSYIEKAEEAADTQIVSAMNTAYGAACTENGILPTEVDAIKPTVVVTDGKVVVTITKVVDNEANTALAAEMQKDFNFYFGENANLELGYYNSFDFEKGNFVGAKN